MNAVVPFVITVELAALILVFGVYSRGGWPALVREAPAIGRLLLGTVLIATILTLIISVGGHAALAVVSTIAMMATVGTLGYLATRRDFQRRTTRVWLAVALAVSLLLLIGNVLVMGGVVH